MLLVQKHFYEEELRKINEETLQISTNVHIQWGNFYEIVCRWLSARMLVFRRDGKSSIPARRTRSATIRIKGTIFIKLGGNPRPRISIPSRSKHRHVNCYSLPYASLILVIKSNAHNFTD